MGSAGVAPHIHDLGTSWRVVNVAYRPPPPPPGKPHVKEAAWALESVWTVFGAEIISHPY
jgi:hypothetical protein